MTNAAPSYSSVTGRGLITTEENETEDDDNNRMKFKIQLPQRPQISSSPLSRKKHLLSVSKSSSNDNNKYMDTCSDKPLHIVSSNFKKSDNLLGGANTLDDGGDDNHLYRLSRKDIHQKNDILKSPRKGEIEDDCLVPSLSRETIVNQRKEQKALKGNSEESMEDGSLIFSKETAVKKQIDQHITDTLSNKSDNFVSDGARTNFLKVSSPSTPSSPNGSKLKRRFKPKHEVLNSSNSLDDDDLKTNGKSKTMFSDMIVITEEDFDVEQAFSSSEFNISRKLEMKVLWQIIREEEIADNYMMPTSSREILVSRRLEKEVMKELMSEEDEFKSRSAKGSTWMQRLEQQPAEQTKITKLEGKMLQGRAKQNQQINNQLDKSGTNTPFNDMQTQNQNNSSSESLFTESDLSDSFSVSTGEYNASDEDDSTKDRRYSKFVSVCASSNSLSNHCNSDNELNLVQQSEDRLSRWRGHGNDILDVKENKDRFSEPVSTSNNIEDDGGHQDPVNLSCTSSPSDMISNNVSVFDNHHLIDNMVSNDIKCNYEAIKQKWNEKIEEKRRLYLVREQTLISNHHHALKALEQRFCENGPVIIRPSHRQEFLKLKNELIIKQKQELKELQSHNEDQIMILIYRRDKELEKAENQMREIMEQSNRHRQPKVSEPIPTKWRRNTARHHMYKNIIV